MFLLEHGINVLIILLYAPTLKSVINLHYNTKLD